MKGSRIELGDVTPHNIKQLKRLNQVIFPVSYNDKFYKDVLEVGELAKLAYFNNIAVGAVCCRVDYSQNQKRLYIMILGYLAPYRRLVIGTKMLNHVLNICEKDGTFDNIYLHVQISNESAIDFYQKFGFEIIKTKNNYYKRIEPDILQEMPFSSEASVSESRPTEQERLQKRREWVEGLMETAGQAEEKTEEPELTETDRVVPSDLAQLQHEDSTLTECFKRSLGIYEDINVNCQKILLAKNVQ